MGDPRRYVRPIISAVRVWFCGIGFLIWRSLAVDMSLVLVGASNAKRQTFAFLQTTATTRIRIHHPIDGQWHAVKEQSDRGARIFSALRWNANSPRREQSRRRKHFAFVTSCCSSRRVYQRIRNDESRFGATSPAPRCIRLFSSSRRLYNDLPQQQDSDGQMNANNMEDTIFALSSGSGIFGGQATAVAVIRISGPRAMAALHQLTTRSCPPRVATLVQLKYEGRLLDQALVLCFPKPHSYTGEDVVELHCHGSRAVVQDVLSTLEKIQFWSDEKSIVERLRYAEAGEFTNRAFTAGKLDVLQVEALADLLASDTVLQKQQALSQLQGDLSRLYIDWKQQLTSSLAHAEAIIDFGDDEHLLEMEEDETESMDDDQKQQVAQQSLWGGVTDKVRNLKMSMERQLNNAHRGEWVRQGFSIAIVGPPNAGKSSLFNILAQDEQAAIVSPVQGTTRDVLSVSLNLGGVKCRLLDTAGLREETLDTIEQEGMKRAQKAAVQADLVLVMLDTSSISFQGSEDKEGAKAKKTLSLEQEIERLVPANDIPREKVMLILNKADLSMPNGDETPNTLKWSASFPGEDDSRIAAAFNISCKTQDGIDSFLKGMTDHILRRVMGSTSDSPDKCTDVQASMPGQEDPLMTRGRHRQHVQVALEALDRFLVLQQDGLVTVDLAAEELRLAASELGRLTGAIDVEDVLDQLFNDFCIGK